MSATVLNGHPVAWSAPAPLWDGLTADPARFAQPTLLRLRGDRFMEELRARLEAAPAGLAALRTTPASHRVRPPGRPAGWEPAGKQVPLKLFGAVHGEYNLVTASLVCQVGGLPERRLRVADGDKVVFVLRRLDAQGREEGWVPGTPEGRWVRAAGAELLDGEELLPMFSLDYRDAGGHPRRLHAGLVPTASVESWTPPPAPAGTPAEEAALAMARYKGEVRQVADAWKTLADGRAWNVAPDQLANARDAVDVLLIDLADLLVRWQPGVWAVVAGTAPSPPPGARSALLAALQDQRIGSGALAHWLRRAWDERDALLGEGGQRTTLGLRLDTATISSESLAGVLLAAPPAASAPPPAGVPGAQPRAPRIAKIDPSGRTEHVIRCAYLRPHCAHVHGPVVSAPSERFRLASFLDLDAPSRDVHIALPIETGVKDLRKLRKSVTVAISEQLQRQMSRVGELKEVIDGDMRKGQEIDFALVCSFSIPIITICALIVLLIFIYLLNIIFFWLPLLRICLPVPKGSA